MPAFFVYASVLDTIFASLWLGEKFLELTADHFSTIFVSSSESGPAVPGADLYRERRIG